jgi:hypothetical protein
MTVQYAVTFEFETRVPLTHRGTVTAGREHVCAARAIKTARAALRPVNWTSLVCVLLERLDADGAEVRL